MKHKHGAWGTRKCIQFLVENMVTRCHLEDLSTDADSCNHSLPEGTAQPKFHVKPKSFL
jgi:hypothetical protein